jgi:hypothetical protein
MQGSPETVAYWQPDRVREYVAGSGFNFVGLLQDGQSVLKYPHRKQQRQCFVSAKKPVDTFA